MAFVFATWQAEWSELDTKCSGKQMQGTFELNGSSWNKNPLHSNFDAVYKCLISMTHVHQSKLETCSISKFLEDARKKLQHY